MPYQTLSLRKIFAIILSVTLITVSQPVSITGCRLLAPPSLNGIESEFNARPTSGLSPDDPNSTADAITIMQDDILEDFKKTSTKENFAYIANLIFIDTYKENHTEELKELSRALGKYINDRAAIGMIASVLTRFMRSKSSFDKYYLRKIFETYSGEELIKVLNALNRLAVRGGLDGKNEDSSDSSSEAKQLKRIIKKSIGKYELGGHKHNAESLVPQLDSICGIYDILNAKYRHTNKRAFYKVLECVEAWCTINSLEDNFTVLKNLLLEAEPHEVDVLLNITMYPVKDYFQSSTTEKVERPRKHNCLKDRFSKIRKLYRQMKFSGVDFKFLADSRRKMEGLYQAHTINFEIVELIMRKSTSPFSELVNHMTIILKKNYKFRPDLSFYSYREENDKILRELENMYEKGYSMIHPVLFENREKLDSIEKNRFSGATKYSPTLTHLSELEDVTRWNIDDNLALLIYCSKYLKTKKGRFFSFSHFNDLAVKTKIASNQIPDLEDRLFSFVLHITSFENEELSPGIFLDYMQQVNQRMELETAKTMLDSLEKDCVDNKSILLLMNLIDTMAYYSSHMEYSRGKSEIAKLVDILEISGLKSAVDAGIKAKLEYEEERYLEGPAENVVRAIEGIDDDQKEKLLGQLSNVLAMESILTSNPTYLLEKRVSEIKTQVSSEKVSFDAIKIEYLAILREIAKRMFGKKAYTVQLASILLYFLDPEEASRGLAEEVKTGEGKSLIIAMLANMTALNGEPVDIITVNTYLAKRDALHYKHFLEFFGNTVSYINDHDESINIIDKNKNVFNANIVFGTNSNFEFLYLFELLDQMPIRASSINGKTTRRAFATAIVDEVDSLFIDEATRPHIISGPGEPMPDWHYRDFFEFFKSLKYASDFKNYKLTKSGWKKYMRFVDSLYKDKMEEKDQFSKTTLKRYANSALRALYYIERDVDYIVGPVEIIKNEDTPEEETFSENDIIIIDENTGAKQYKTHWTHGLHQFVQLKEGIEPEKEHKPAVTITHPFYFSKYNNIFTITGTIGSKTDEIELLDVYGVRTVRLPPNKPSKRIDMPNTTLKTEKEKWDFVISEIKSIHEEGRPILVGVLSIKESVMLSEMLKKKNIEHQLLNGLQDQPQEIIIQNAGKKGKVTVATNLAGRGADILLGKGVEELGGLHVIGTFKFKAGRIDDQLKGRAGRQGQNGSTHFINSLEDDLFIRFLDEVLSDRDIEPEELGALSTENLAEITVDTQRRAESYHLNWRKKTNRIYSVQDRHMNIFFNMVHRYFNLEIISRIFPELSKSNLDLATSIKLGTVDENHSFFRHSLNKDLLNNWTDHLHRLDELMDKFDEIEGYKFEIAFFKYKIAAGKSFKSIKKNIMDSIAFFVGYYTDLSKKEIRKRLRQNKRQIASKPIKLPEPNRSASISN